MTEHEAASIVEEVRGTGDRRMEASACRNPWHRGIPTKHLGVALRLFPDTGRELRMFVAARRDWEAVRDMWLMLLKEVEDA